jgi:hypothetical protein
MYRRDPCPKCGALKRHTAALCGRCRRAEYQSIQHAPLSKLSLGHEVRTPQLVAYGRAADDSLPIPYIRRD